MSSTRREFLKSTSLAAAGLGLTATACNSTEPVMPDSLSGNIRRPLDIIKRENISITDIKVTPLSYVPPDGRYLWGVSQYVVWKADSALVEVFTDQGIVGFAEGSPYSNPAKIKAYTDTHITPFLKGKNPFDVDFLTSGGPWREYLARAAWAGVHNALWDIIGKAKGQPLYKLLATDCEPKKKMEIYASGGVEHAWYDNGVEALIEEALRYKEQGYRAFKFRNGTSWEHDGMTLERYIPILRKLREAVGPDFKLMLEKHNWTFEQITEQLAPALEDLKFYWYEEPMNQWEEGSLERHLKIKEVMPSVMISGGERFVNRFQIHPWIVEGAYDLIQTDCNFTGISENWHIARLAHLFGRLQCPHSWHGGLTTISNIHFIASAPNGHMCELNQTFNPLKEELFKEPLTVVDGFMELPDKPGYGVELIDNPAEKFPWAEGSYLKPNPKL
ncbi:MAG: mandelate racemase/muconate lactonizing enzyme family protein [Bacteroidota bacterium]